MTRFRFRYRVRYVGVQDSVERQKRIHGNHSICPSYSAKLCGVEKLQWNLAGRQWEFWGAQGVKYMGFVDSKFVRMLLMGKVSAVLSWQSVFVDPNQSLLWKMKSPKTIISAKGNCQRWESLILKKVFNSCGKSGVRGVIFRSTRHARGKRGKFYNPDIRAGFEKIMHGIYYWKKCQTQFNLELNLQLLVKVIKFLSFDIRSPKALVSLGMLFLLLLLWLFHYIMEFKLISVNFSLLLYENCLRLFYDCSNLNI